jgi:hypothetical protein
VGLRSHGRSQGFKSPRLHQRKPANPGCATSCELAVRTGGGRPVIFRWPLSWMCRSSRCAASGVRGGGLFGRHLENEEVRPVLPARRSKSVCGSPGPLDHNARRNDVPIASGASGVTRWNCGRRMPFVGPSIRVRSALRVYDHIHGALVDPEVGSWQAGHSSGGAGGRGWVGPFAGAHARI